MPGADGAQQSPHHSPAPGLRVGSGARSAASPAWVVNPALPGSKKTFCVLGVARGGTSMVAGALMQLGVPMGDNLDKDNIEDQDFLSHSGVRSLFTDAKLEPVRDSYLEKVRSLIEARNAERNVWGWKDPLVAYYLPLVAGALVNSHFILVMRDPAAVATREMLERMAMSAQRIFGCLAQSITEYQKSIELLGRLRRPTLLVSYERSLRFPEEFAKIMHGFVHPEQAIIPQETLEKLVSYVVPDRRTGDINAAISRDDARPQEVHTATSVLAAPVFGDFETYYSLIDGLAARPTPADDELAPPRPPVIMDDAEFMAWQNKVYSAAASALNRGDRDTAATLGYRIIVHLVPRLPIVGLGPVAVMRVSEVDPSAVARLPDLFVGCYNIIGMAALLAGDAATACDYCEAAYTLARQKLETGDPVHYPISANLLWWLAFHMALAAKHAGRHGLKRQAIDAIRLYLDDVKAGAEDRLNAASARDAYERASREGLTAAKRQMAA